MSKMSGYYGAFGGQFMPETLIPAIDALEKEFVRAMDDADFHKELTYYLNDYAGRPTPLYHARKLSALTGAEVYLKREDLLHTGAHKINNAIGQALLTKYMGKKRVIAETGAGQHGVATATVCALFGFECVVYMGELDVARQQPNVKRMELLGATVHPVTQGQKTLKDAMNVALQDWVTNVESTHYMIGTASGPHPFPELVAQFQSVIGREARQSCVQMGFLPDYVIACIGGGSNAIGIFRGFVHDKDVQLIGVEAGGISDVYGEHARSIGMGRPGILHGTLTYLVQTADSQVGDVHSVSAGLDYPGVGPEHAHLHDTGRVQYDFVRDEEALAAFYELTRQEGIVPALESSHAIAYLLKHKEKFAGKRVVVNLSGRGDKDLAYVLGLGGAK